MNHLPGTCFAHVMTSFNSWSASWTNDDIKVSSVSFSTGLWWLILTGGSCSRRTLTIGCTGISLSSKFSFERGSSIATPSTSPCAFDNWVLDSKTFFSVTNPAALSDMQVLLEVGSKVLLVVVLVVVVLFPFKGGFGEQDSFISLKSSLLFCIRRTRVLFWTVWSRHDHIMFRSRVWSLAGAGVRPHKAVPDYSHTQPKSLFLTWQKTTSSSRSCSQQDTSGTSDGRCLKVILHTVRPKRRQGHYCVRPLHSNHNNTRKTSKMQLIHSRRRDSRGVDSTGHFWVLVCSFVLNFVSILTLPVYLQKKPPNEQSSAHEKPLLLTSNIVPIYLPPFSLHFEVIHGGFISQTTATFTPRTWKEVSTIHIQTASVKKNCREDEETFDKSKTCLLFAFLLHNTFWGDKLGNIFASFCQLCSYSLQGKHIWTRLKEKKATQSESARTATNWCSR